MAIPSNAPRVPTPPPEESLKGLTLRLLAEDKYANLSNADTKALKVALKQLETGGNEEVYSELKGRIQDALNEKTGKPPLLKKIYLSFMKSQGVRSSRTELREALLPEIIHLFFGENGKVGAPLSNSYLFQKLSSDEQKNVRESRASLILKNPVLNPTLAEQRDLTGDLLTIRDNYVKALLSQTEGDAVNLLNAERAFFSTFTTEVVSKASERATELTLSLGPSDERAEARVLMTEKALIDGFPHDRLTKPDTKENIEKEREIVKNSGIKSTPLPGSTQVVLNELRKNYDRLRPDLTYRREDLVSALKSQLEPSGSLKAKLDAYNRDADKALALLEQSAEALTPHLGHPAAAKQYALIKRDQAMLLRDKLGFEILSNVSSQASVNFGKNYHQSGNFESAFDQVLKELEGKPEQQKLWKQNNEVGYALESASLWMRYADNQVYGAAPLPVEAKMETLLKGANVTEQTNAKLKFSKTETEVLKEAGLNSSLSLIDSRRLNKLETTIVPELFKALNAEKDKIELKLAQDLKKGSISPELLQMVDAYEKSPLFQQLSERIEEHQGLLRPLLGNPSSAANYARGLVATATLTRSHEVFIKGLKIAFSNPGPIFEEVEHGKSPLSAFQEHLSSRVKGTKLGESFQKAFDLEEKALNFASYAERMGNGEGALIAAHLYTEFGDWGSEHYERSYFVAAQHIDRAVEKGVYGAKQAKANLYAQVYATRQRLGETNINETDSVNAFKALSRFGEKTQGLYLLMTHGNKEAINPLVDAIRSRYMGFSNFRTPPAIEDLQMLTVAALTGNKAAQKLVEELAVKHGNEPEILLKAQHLIRQGGNSDEPLPPELTTSLYIAQRTRTHLGLPPLEIKGPTPSPLLRTDSAGSTSSSESELSLSAPSIDFPPPPQPLETSRIAPSLDLSRPQAERASPAADAAMAETKNQLFHDFRDLSLDLIEGNAVGRISQKEIDAVGTALRNLGNHGFELTSAYQTELESLKGRVSLAINTPPSRFQTLYAKGLQTLGIRAQPGAVLQHLRRPLATAVQQQVNEVLNNFPDSPQKTAYVDALNALASDLGRPDRTSINTGHLIYAQARQEVFFNEVSQAGGQEPTFSLSKLILAIGPPDMKENVRFQEAEKGLLKGEIAQEVFTRLGFSTQQIPPKAEPAIQQAQNAFLDLRRSIDSLKTGALNSPTEKLFDLENNIDTAKALHRFEKSVNDSLKALDAYEGTVRPFIGTARGRTLMASIAEARHELIQERRTLALLNFVQTRTSSAIRDQVTTLVASGKTLVEAMEAALPKSDLERMSQKADLTGKKAEAWARAVNPPPTTPSPSSPRPLRRDAELEEMLNLLVAGNDEAVATYGEPVNSPEPVDSTQVSHLLSSSSDLNDTKPALLDLLKDVPLGENELFVSTPFSVQDIIAALPPILKEASDEDRLDATIENEKLALELLKSELSQDPMNQTLIRSIGSYLDLLWKNL